VALLC